MNYTKDDFKALFQAKFDYTKWFTMLRDFFKADELRHTAEPISNPADCDKGYYMGAINTSDSYRIGLFYYEIGHSNVARKKVGLRNLVRTFINPNWGQFDAALAVFSDGEHWRLSLISDIKGEATAAKRFTFVFGEKDNLYRTALERFALIRAEGPSFEVLKKAFSVEALTEEFFGLYKEHYERFCDFIYQNANDSRYFGPEFAQWNSQEDTRKFIRDYVKNLMGRIVFLQFLQKKGWMGVPTDRDDWTGGDPYFMQHLYDYATEEQKEDFLDKVLEPLFFNCLNVSRPNDVFDTNIKGIGSVKVPYLNGELFEQKEVDKAQSRFPQKYFHDLLNLFLQYNFTIDENDPNDAEIGVDPEMLGKIFENLLEDNKDKGAFYTPKEIVRYMCKESLIAYLCSNNGAKHADSIKVLVNNHQLTSKLQEDFKTCERLNKHLRNVKVCDPAIGSGAFPMGLMNEIFSCRSVLHENIEETDEETSGQIKREIIQNNIYGVDIEQGAVDIARLRFWLALVVDSVKPEPLPNLDYKIMQGNSLIESYKGLDLSNLLQSEDLFVATRAEELERHLKSYFRATDNEEKKKLRAQIDFTVKQCIYAAGIQETIELPNTDFFLWHTYFQDVFKKGGFDIVIGNPPYGAKLSDADKALYRNLYPETQFKIDTYSLFTLRAMKLMSIGGYASFILPNTLLDNYYEENVRLKLLKNFNIVEINDLNDKIFDNAVVHSMIISFINNRQAEYDVKVNASANLYDEPTFIPAHYFLSQPNCMISIRTYESRGLWDKISDGCIDLEKVIDIRQAIKTGNDKFYLCDTKKADNFKPILRGKDIGRYSYKESGLFVDYGKYLACPRSASIFEQPKILIREAGAKITATYDDKNFYIMSSLYNALLIDKRFSLKYVLALINSTLFQFLMNKLTFEKTKGAFTKAKIYHYYKLPVKVTDKQDEVIKLVDKALSLRKDDATADISHIDHKLDLIIFKLYKLSYEEVKAVNPEITITEEEYNKE